MSRKTAEASKKIGKAAPTIHNARIADFDASKDRSNLALAGVLDTPEGRR
jgi:hypothetical protein